MSRAPNTFLLTPYSPPNSEVLHRSADLFVERGWCRGSRGMIAAESGALCAEGALCTVLGLPSYDAARMNRGTYAPGTRLYSYTSIEPTEVYLALAAYVDLDPWDHLFDWNDAQPDAAPVIEAFRGAALMQDAYEHGLVSQ